MSRRRRKELHVTREGAARLTAATAKWPESQFEKVFGQACSTAA